MEDHIKSVVEILRYEGASNDIVVARIKPVPGTDNKITMEVPDPLAFIDGDLLIDAIKRAMNKRL